MPFSAPSAEELAARGGDFDNQLLPEDEYVFEVKEINVQKDQKNPYNNEVRDTLQVRLKPISFADKQPVVDVDGNDVKDDKLVFDFIDPTKIGMKPQPSKARKFFTGSLGVPVQNGFDIDEWNDLVGKRLLGTLVIKDRTKDGVTEKVNRVTGYRALPTRPRRAAATETAPAAEATEAPASDKAASDDTQDDW